MPAYTWVSLAFFLLCLTGGATLAALRWRAFRRAKPAVRRIVTSAEELAARSTELERRVAVLEPKVAQLQRDTARLSRAVARARVLFGAVHEVRTVVRVARIFGP